MKTMQEALHIIENLELNTSIIKKPLYECINYTLAQDIYAPINVPSFNKSAMDGFCLKKEDLNKIDKFKIIATVYAGEENNYKLAKGECIKIMTGAKVFSDGNIVIQKELAQVEKDYVKFTLPSTPLKDNICIIGEDIKEGEIVFKKGQLLKPICISILKSLGINTVEVYQKPRICLISIGDELIENIKDSEVINLEKSATDLEKSTIDFKEKRMFNMGSHIYNSNEAFIYTRLLENNLTDIDTYTIDDDINKLENIFTKQYDLFITTGAISVGDKDIVRKYIENNSVEVHFDKINIMPGGPSCMFSQNNKLVLSLAGSPYANFVTFEMLAMTLLSVFTYNEKLKPRLTQRCLKTNWDKVIKKPRFIRAYTDNENCYIKSTNHKASCIYTMHECNSFIFAAQKEKIEENSLVNVYLFGGV